jgi:hypothetical protein
MFSRLCTGAYPLPSPTAPDTVLRVLACVPMCLRVRPCWCSCFSVAVCVVCMGAIGWAAHGEKSTSEFAWFLPDYHPLPHGCVFRTGLLIQTSTGTHVASMSYNSTRLLLGTTRAVNASTYTVLYRVRTTSRVSCYDHFMAGSRSSGVYSVDRGFGPRNVYCDMTLSGGGWDLVSAANEAFITVRSTVFARCCRCFTTFACAHQPPPRAD